DMIIHCVFNEPDGTYRYRPDLVERLAAAKAWVNPTLYVMKAGIERFAQAQQRAGQLTAELGAHLDRQRRALETRVEAVGRRARPGAGRRPGPDSPWGWTAPGEFLHEIDMLPQAGLSYGDAIAAATTGSAESIGVADVAGRLAPGRLADILVARGDPTQKIT